jgi:Uma2 family endonuclease
VALHERSALLTYDDYVLFPDDGRRHEIIDGEHTVTPAPFLRHQALVRRFILALGAVIERGGLGELFPAPVDVLLTRHDIVQPDLVFIAKERLDILTEANVQGAPDLVIEILSPATRRKDEGEKRELYARPATCSRHRCSPGSGSVSPTCSPDA